MNKPFELYAAEARDILSTKNSGPSGVLAYTWANAVREVEVINQSCMYTYNMPYIDRNSALPLDAYFTVVRSNRTGIEVVAPPGGTQDLIFNWSGKERFAELAKPKKQIELLKETTGIELSGIDDQSFVAHLLADLGFSDIRLEDAFDAAVRETEEEHGLNYNKVKDKVSDISEGDYELLSKRSFQKDPDNPTPISQKIFTMCVSEFKGESCRRTDKVETKIPEMMGNEFYEQGDYMSLADLEKSLSHAQSYLQMNGHALPPIALFDYKATASRLDVVRSIRAGLKPPANI